MMKILTILLSLMIVSCSQDPIANLDQFYQLNYVYDYHKKETFETLSFFFLINKDDLDRISHIVIKHKKTDIQIYIDIKDLNTKQEKKQVWIGKNNIRISQYSQHLLRGEYEVNIFNKAQKSKDLTIFIKERKLNSYQKFPLYSNEEIDSPYYPVEIWQKDKQTIVEKKKKVKLQKNFTLYTKKGTTGIMTLY